MTKTSKTTSGDTETQITIFTDRINNINQHLKVNKKDHSSRRGLLLLVSKRQRMLKYLKRKNYDNYLKLTEKLKIRK
tara:strand:- start:539 stop:769 length:231 start_codon:yes stop_codon:yes gene_type:complete